MEHQFCFTALYSYIIVISSYFKFSKKFNFFWKKKSLPTNFQIDKKIKCAPLSGSILAVRCRTIFSSHFLGSPNKMPSGVSPNKLKKYFVFSSRKVRKRPTASLFWIFWHFCVPKTTLTKTLKLWFHYISLPC